MLRVYPYGLLIYPLGFKQGQIHEKENINGINFIIG